MQLLVHKGDIQATKGIHQNARPNVKILVVLTLLRLILTLKKFVFSGTNYR